MLALIRFFTLAAIKIAASVLYTWECRGISDPPADVWQKCRLVVILNHTSLFEPIFSRMLPFSFLWRLARFATFPAAEKTMSRPITGALFRLMVPKVISITRTRDATWNRFLDGVSPESIIMILPEGRMKRPNGLDKDGKPMTVRGGIADILGMLDSGNMLIAYSGGLHHMQSPGQKFPRLFRNLKLNMESLKIQDYKLSLGKTEDFSAFKVSVIKDLEYRRDTNCPVG